MSYSTLRGTTSVGLNQMRWYLKLDRKLNKISQQTRREASGGVWKFHQLLDSGDATPLFAFLSLVLGHSLIAWLEREYDLERKHTSWQHHLSNFDVHRLVAFNRDGFQADPLMPKILAQPNYTFMLKHIKDSATITEYPSFRTWQWRRPLLRLWRRRALCPLFLLLLAEEQVGFLVTKELENAIEDCKAKVERITKDCREKNGKFSKTKSPS